MMGNYFNSKTPFHKVYVHALVRDEKGQKMSNLKEMLLTHRTYKRIWS